MRKCVSPRRVLVCALFVVALCGLYFVPSRAWHGLEWAVYRVLRTVGPVFRGSCLPDDGPPPPRVSIAVVTLHHEKDELYKISHNNKKRYCNHHGYTLLDGTGWFGGEQSQAAQRKGLSYYSWRKVQFVCEMLEQSHHLHWLFWMDTDTLFMNMQIKLPRLLAGVSDDDVIVVAPDAEGLNAGTFFIRNNKQGRKFCLRWLEKRHLFRYEQQALSALYNEAVRRSGQDCHVTQPDDLSLPSGVRACLDRKAPHFRVLKLCAMGSWGGLEWRHWHGYYFQGFYMYGDFIVHFAGDKKDKLPMMRLAAKGML